jgi:hypothetical protein
MNIPDILERNLFLVFNERDTQKRLHALAELYTGDAVLYEPENIVVGQSAISDTVEKLLASMPPGFQFTPVGSATGHHDLLCTRWTGGIAGGPVIVSGTDVAHLKDGRIASLYVLIDSPQ